MGSTNGEAGSKLSRRQFLKRSGATAAALYLTASMPATAWAEQAEKDGYGILVDISRCAGCNCCAAACKRANGLPVGDSPPQCLDSEAYCYVDTRQVTNLEGEEVTRYVKRQCMHCLNAACVSACPAAAMHKTEEGPVAYRAGRCLGCRYCQIGCPFGVPQFDWNNGINPEIRKCWMCADRLEEGKEPACVEACPMGAIRFGSRKQLLAEAKGKIASNPGRYVDHVFGEHEVGGTSVLYISDVPFEELGFPGNLPDTAPSEETEKIMTKLPFVIGGLAIALSGTAAYTHRHPEQNEDITES